LASPVYGDLAPIEGTDKVLLTTIFNGTLTTLYHTETWVYDLSENSWHNERFRTKPSFAQTYALETISGTDKVLLFTGFYNTTVNTTWVYTHNTISTNGTYVSAPYQFDNNTSYKQLSWDAKVPESTTLKFLVRTGKSKSELLNNSFIGPEGDPLSFYEQSSSPLWSGHAGEPWLQIKAYLNTTVPATPILESINVSFNYWPDAEPVYPINNSITSITYPVFRWNFTDKDTFEQKAFQLIIDDNNSFNSINFDSGIFFTRNLTWDFPNGTGYSQLPDGAWYWKVRVQDDDDDWGFYSNYYKFILNTRAPVSNITYPVNGEIYPEADTFLGTAIKAPNGTQVKGVELLFQRVSDDLFWDGLDWRRDDELWYLTEGANNWTFEYDGFKFDSGEEYRVFSRAIDHSNNIELPGPGTTFIIDSEPVFYSKPWPKEDVSFNTTNISFGVTISDLVSGVNTSSIEYTVSFDSGQTWEDWISVPKANMYTVNNNDNNNKNENMSVDITLTLTFQNGTGNRIKYRASDLVENGPTQSREYLIMVNTWQPPQEFPIVTLQSPANGTVMPATYMKLSWILDLGTQKLSGVTYNVYLDTVEPPQKLLVEDEINTSLWVQDLENEQRYYWTVMPKYNNLNGTCLSGVWWFRIDIPIPMVILTSPENRSVISDLSPTLVWTLDYKGSEPVLYDLYFSEANTSAHDQDQKLELEPEPQLELRFEKLETNYLTLNEILEDNVTYYWYVVPWVGKYRGIGSEVWSFTIDAVGKNYSSFKLDLTLDPKKLILEPGDMLSVRAKVVNLGTGPDVASLNFKYPPDKGVGVLINGQNRLELAERAEDELELTVVAMLSAQLGVVNITVVAYSRTMGYLNETVNSEEILTVVIREPVDNGKADPGTDQEPGFNTGTMISVIIPFIILIIVVGIVLFFAILANRKKKKDETEKELADDQILESSEDEKVVAPTEEETSEE
jgi:hypothetical protein